MKELSQRYCGIWFCPYGPWVSTWFISRKTRVTCWYDNSNKCSMSWYQSGNTWSFESDTALGFCFSSLDPLCYSSWGHWCSGREDGRGAAAFPAGGALWGEYQWDVHATHTHSLPWNLFSSYLWVLQVICVADSVKLFVLASVCFLQWWEWREDPPHCPVQPSAKSSRPAAKTRYFPFTWPAHKKIDRHSNADWFLSLEQIAGPLNLCPGPPPPTAASWHHRYRPHPPIQWDDSSSPLHLLHRVSGSCPDLLHLIKGSKTNSTSKIRKRLHLLCNNLLVMLTCHDALMNLWFASKNKLVQ